MRYILDSKGNVLQRGNHIAAGPQQQLVESQEALQGPMSWYYYVDGHFIKRTEAEYERYVQELQAKADAANNKERDIWRKENARTVELMKLGESGEITTPELYELLKSMGIFNKLLGKYNAK